MQVCLSDLCAAPLQNSSIDLAGATAGAEAGDAGGGPGAAAAAAAALLQGACDLCTPLAPGSLLPPDQAHLARFHLKASSCAYTAGIMRRYLQLSRSPLVA